MGRPATPLEAANRTGATRHDPERFAAAAKVSTELGDHPEWFNPAQLQVWNEIIVEAIPGVITGADRKIVELVSVLMAEFRADTVKFTAVKHGKLLTYLAHLGMTPSGRRSVAVTGKGKAPADAFDDF